MKNKSCSTTKILVGIIIAAFLGCRVPHTGRVIAKLIIPPIKIGKVVIYQDALLLFIPIMIVIHEIKRKYPKARTLVLLIGLIIIVPITSDVLELSLYPFYNIGNEANSIDIESSSYSFSFSDTEKSINLKAHIVNHSFKDKKIRMCLVLPEELSIHGFPSTIDFPKEHYIYKNKSKDIDMHYDISSLEWITFDSLNTVDYVFSDYSIRVYCEDEHIDIKQIR